MFWGKSKLLAIHYGVWVPTSETGADTVQDSFILISTSHAQFKSFLVRPEDVLQGNFGALFPRCSLLRTNVLTEGFMSSWWE